MLNVERELTLRRELTLSVELTLFVSWVEASRAPTSSEHQPETDTRWNNGDAADHATRNNVRHAFAGAEVLATCCDRGRSVQERLQLPAKRGLVKTLVCSPRSLALVTEV